MDVPIIADKISRNRIVLIVIFFFVVFIFFAPIIPVEVVKRTTEIVPSEVQRSKMASVPYNETSWVKVYRTDAVEPPVEKEEVQLLYHVKGECTNRIPDYRRSSTRMEVHNLDSVPGNFTFFIGMEVKRNSDVEGYEGDIEEPTTEPVVVIGPCESEECEEESKETPTPIEVKPTNIVLGEEKSVMIGPGEYGVFTYDVDIDIRQCIFREVSIPTKTVYKEIGVRNTSGQIEYWYEQVNETIYRNETVLVNDTVYKEIETSSKVHERWTVWQYLTQPKETTSDTLESNDYTLPPYEY